jgi:hypothetical protein
MGDLEDRARLIVAIEGLRYLLSPNGANKRPVTRNQLFQTLEKNKNDANIKKALHSKGWQKSYADRMVELGFLEKIREGGSDMYQVGVEDGLLVILKDWLDGHGELISTIIFADSSTSSELLTEMVVRKAKAIAGITESGEDTAAPSEPSASPITKEDTTQAVKELVDSANNSAVVNRGLRQEIDLIRADFIRHYKESDKTIAQLVSSINGAVRALKEGKVETSVSSSLDQAYAAKLEESVETRLTKISADLDNLTRWADVAEKVIAKMLDHTVVIPQLQSQLKTLESRLSTHQEDKLGHVVKTMEAAMELLVDAIAEKKK